MDSVCSLNLHRSDRGVDIFAYRDPLGTPSPRMKVQIKHRESPETAQEVRELMGLLQKDGDVGIFISSGGFGHVWHQKEGK
jgi:restriction system protein